MRFLISVLTGLPLFAYVWFLLDKAGIDADAPGFWKYLAVFVVCGVINDLGVSISRYMRAPLR